MTALQYDILIPKNALKTPVDRDAKKDKFREVRSKLLNNIYGSTK